MWEPREGNRVILGQRETWTGPSHSGYVSVTIPAGAAGTLSKKELQIIHVTLWVVEFDDYPPKGYMNVSSLIERYRRV